MSQNGGDNRVSVEIGNSCQEAGIHEGNGSMTRRLEMRKHTMVLTGLFASSILFFAALTQAAQATEPPGEANQAVASPVPSPLLASGQPPSTSRTVSSDRAAMMYRRLWGIDDIHVRKTSSGALVRFSYRVLDANKATVLNDKKSNPYLIEEKTGAKLEVPTMEKVGTLRQVAPPQNGREYWMVFFDRGHLVKPGTRVSVVIGNFHMNGLVVEPD